jgi:hypothetical protein
MRSQCKIFSSSSDKTYTLLTSIANFMGMDAPSAIVPQLGDQVSNASALSGRVGVCLIAHFLEYSPNRIKRVGIFKMRNARTGRSQ